MISVTLSKQHALDVDAKGIMQIGFARNLDKPGNLPMFFFIKKSKETTLGFFQGTVRVLQENKRRKIKKQAEENKKILQNCG